MYSLKTGGWITKPADKKRPNLRRSEVLGKKLDKPLERGGAAM